LNATINNENEVNEKHDKWIKEYVYKKIPDIALMTVISNSAIIS